MGVKVNKLGDALSADGSECPGPCGFEEGAANFCDWMGDWRDCGEVARESRCEACGEPLLDVVLLDPEGAYELKGGKVSKVDGVWRVCINVGCKDYCGV